ncbi:MAG: DUF2341 domain-containing protein [Candidatus Thermoplasmatota archaeon]
MNKIKVLIILLIFFLVSNLSISFESHENKLNSRAGENYGSSWMQTTKEDFDGGTKVNVDTSVSPGDVMLIPSPLLGWNYRKPINITNSVSALTDYQVLVTFNTASLISDRKMRPDCGDIRFTDSDCSTSLNYWLESGCNSTDTRIWLKIPSVPVGSKTIYMYYSNHSATSISNGDNTFLFFDDFENGNLNKWKNILGNWQIASDQASSGSYSMRHGNWSLCQRTYPQIAPLAIINEPNVSLDASWRISTTDVDLSQCVRYDATSPPYTNYQTNLEYEEGWDIAKENVTGWYEIAANQGKPVTVNKWTKITTIIQGTSMKVLKDDVQITPPAGWTDVGKELQSGSIGFRICYINQGNHWWVDDVRARKYTFPEPKTSVGEEEYLGVGTFISSIKDTGISNTPLEWLKISWDASIPAGASIKFNTRTSQDRKSWSLWSSDYTSSPSTITSPSNRYIQYKVTLSTTASIPVLHDVKITYNRPAQSPILLSPINNIYVRTITPTFQLYSEDDDLDLLKYKIELSKDNFKTVYKTYDQTINVLGWSATSYSSRDIAEYTILVDEFLPEGSYCWRAYASDGSGFSLASLVYYFLLDYSPPVASIKNLGTYTNKTSFNVSWYGSDSFSGIEYYDIQYSNDGIEWYEWLNKINFTSAEWKNTTDGNKVYFRARAMDNAGNLQFYPYKADTFTTIDTSSPTSRIEPLEKYQNNKTFYLKWKGEDKISGIDYYKIYVAENDSKYKLFLNTSSESAIFKGFNGIKYSFYSIAVDKAGNIENKTTADTETTINISTEPEEKKPRLIAEIGDQVIIEGELFELNLSNYFEGGGLTFTSNVKEIEINGSIAYWKPYGIVSLGNVIFTAEDRYGNMVSSSPINITVIEREEVKKESLCNYLPLFLFILFFIGVAIYHKLRSEYTVLKMREAVTEKEFVEKPKKEEYEKIYEKKPQVEAVKEVKPKLPTIIGGVFLIYFDGRVIAKKFEGKDISSEIFGGMLTAMQNFVSERLGKSPGITELKYENLGIIIERGSMVYLASIVSGEERKEMRGEMRRLLLDIHKNFGDTLKRWDGTLTAFKDIEKYLDDFLKGKYREA